MIRCKDCVYHWSCDDGGGYWDIWCDKNPDQTNDNEYNYALGKDCTFFKDWPVGMTRSEAEDA